MEMRDGKTCKNCCKKNWLIFPLYNLRSALCQNGNFLDVKMTTSCSLVFVSGQDNDGKLCRVHHRPWTSSVVWGHQIWTISPTQEGLHCKAIAVSVWRARETRERVGIDIITITNFCSSEGGERWIMPPPGETPMKFSVGGLGDERIRDSRSIVVTNEKVHL